jgi:hypothetical protein
VGYHSFLFKQAAVASRLARLFPGSISTAGGLNPLSYEGKVPPLLRRALYRSSLPAKQIGQEDAAKRLSRFMGLAGAQNPYLGSDLSRIAQAGKGPAPEGTEELMKSWIRMNRGVFGSTEPGRGVLSRASRYGV